SSPSPRSMSPRPAGSIGSPESIAPRRKRSPQSSPPGSEGSLVVDRKRRMSWSAFSPFCSHFGLEKSFELIESGDGVPPSTPLSRSKEQPPQRSTDQGADHAEAVNPAGAALTSHVGVRS